MAQTDDEIRVDLDCIEQYLKGAPGEEPILKVLGRVRTWLEVLLRANHDHYELPSSKVIDVLANLVVAKEGRCGDCTQREQCEFMEQRGLARACALVHIVRAEEVVANTQKGN